MEEIPKYLRLIILLYLPFLFVINGCRNKGCTDKMALNYNITAKDDDGTCIYCKINIFTDTVSNNLIDTNSSSPFYNQNVATFYFTQTSYKCNYTNCNMPDSCIISLQIQNHTNRNMDFSYQSYIFTNGGGAANNTASIPANQRINCNYIIANGNNPCEQLENYSGLWLYNVGHIVYN